MSRSKKKTPIIGNTTAPSEKIDKVFFHRRSRRYIKQQLKITDDPIDNEHKRSGSWIFDKDGKHYLKNKELINKYLRK